MAIGRRTGIDFKDHQLIIKKHGDDIIEHWLKKPDTVWDNVKFLSTNENLIVTGDYSNWMFDRAFTPHATDEDISDSYWCEKLKRSSTQDPYDFDDDATKKALEEGIEGGLEEYGYEDERLGEMIQYYEDCLCHLDCKEIYLAYAHENLPRFCDHEQVVYLAKEKYHLQVVFDAFEEVCRRLKEVEDRELEQENDSDEIIITSNLSPREVVDKLNDLLYEIYGDNYEGELFYHKYNYFFDSIYFGDALIYHSENNDRKFSEDDNKYECLFEYCKKEFYKMAKYDFDLASALINKKSAN